MLCPSRGGSINGALRFRCRGWRVQEKGSLCMTGYDGNLVGIVEGQMGVYEDKEARKC